MPLPQPRKNETHKAFRSRCMTDPVMAGEYPDQDQRLAICEKQWDQRVKASSAPAHLYVEAGGSVDIQAAEGDGEKKLRRFTGTAYTGGVMRPSRFFTPVVVDLSGVKVKRGSRPILKEHDPEQIVGHSEEVKVTERSISVAGVVSGVGEAAREVVETSANGFPWKLSLGASVDKMVRVDEGEKVEVNGQTFSGPLLVARKTTLGEISFVALAADDRTSAKVAASAAEQEIEVIAMTFDDWLKARGFDPEKLDDKQKESLQAMYEAEKASHKDPPGDDKSGQKDVEAGADAQHGLQATGADHGEGDQSPEPFKQLRAKHAAELERLRALDQICAGHPEIHIKAVREGWNKERAELEVLRASRPRGPAIHSEDGNGRSAESIEAALCLSAGMDEKWLAAHYDERTMNAALSRRMRDTTIHVVMDSVIQAAGRHYGGSRKSNEFIRAALDAERTLRASSGFSTMSLSGILSNVANKAMIAAYEAIETVHSAIAAYRSHSDFKVYTRYRLDASGAFQKVGPDGELKHVGLSEASYTNQLDTWGAIIALTRQMMINDDLGAFLEIPTLLGRMSAIAVEEEVFKLLLSNPNNFFSAGNNNLLTGASSALSIDSLGDGEKLFINQVDSNKKPILVTPRVLLVGAPLKTLADDLWNETQVMVTTMADKRRFATNPHKGKYRPFVSPYLNNTAITDRNGDQISGQSDTQWYLFADPNIRAAIAVATLNGRRIPTIESDDASFDVLGMQWRAYHDFGVGMEDPVAAVKSDGA